MSVTISINPSRVDPWANVARAEIELQRAERKIARMITKKNQDVLETLLRQVHIARNELLAGYEATISADLSDAGYRARMRRKK